MRKWSLKKNIKLANEEIFKKDKEIQNLLWIQEDRSQRITQVDGLVESIQKTGMARKGKLFKEHLG